MEVVTDDVQHVLGYVRCSTEEQADSGAGIAAQIALIETECERRGWPRPDIVADEGRSGASLHRPGLQEVIEQINARQVDVLVVAKLDRLSRSVVDFSAFLT